MKTTIIVTLLASVQIMSPAMADPAKAPAYIGLRTGNPERDTFAFLRSDENSRRLAFIGPVRQFGTETGDPEKDTCGYQAFVVERVAKTN